MIHFDLRCEGGHSFDGWFRSGEDFERQRAGALVSCPFCGSGEVSKALMRPAIASGTRPGATEAPGPVAGGMSVEKAAEIHGKLQALAREVRAKADYVGRDFAEEARRIHFGESPERRIYGEASGPEVKALAEDGIPALPLPPLPEDGH